MFTIFYTAGAHRAVMAGAAGFEPATYAGVKVRCVKPLRNAPIYSSSISQDPQVFGIQGTARPGGDQPHTGGRGEV